MDISNLVWAYESKKVGMADVYVTIDVDMLLIYD